jgi:acetolactate synthase-1/2/3 large subunit
MLLTWKAIDFLDYEDPLKFGSPGVMGCRAANFMVQNCDFLLVVGSRLEPSVTAFNSAAFGVNAKKAMVDIDAAEIRKIAGLEVALASDAGDFLRELVAKGADASPKPHAAWLDYCRDLKRRYPVVLPEYRTRDSKRNGVNLYVFTDMLFERLKADDVITPESSGAAGEVTYQAMRVKKGQLIKNAAGLGSMGFGLPYSIGACLACGKRRTILINGDGAFQLNIQELETLARLKLPVKIFIFDNRGYGSIMNTQRNMFGGFYVGSEPGSGYTVPDIGAVASAYGLRALRAESHEELPAAIEATLAGDDPALCVVKVEAEHVTAPKVQAMKLPDGGMLSKPLEDMWPYLAPEELAANMIAKKAAP